MRDIRTVAVVGFVVAQWSLPARAQHVIEPGDGVVMAVADDCVTAESGSVLIHKDARCSAATATAGAEVRVNAFNDIGNPRAAAALWNTFQVTETAPTADRLIGAWIAYDVAWKGLLRAADIVSDASVEVSYELTDLTTSELVKSDLIWGRATSGFKTKVGGKIPVEIALHVDEGSTVDTIPAILVRGHTYRFLIRVTCSARLFGETGGMACNYHDESLGYGVSWRGLSVKLGADDREVADRLDRLETEVETIKDEIEKLKSHTHEYRTGKGEGHNNTPAQSGPPVPGSEAGATCTTPRPPSRPGSTSRATIPPRS